MNTENAHEIIKTADEANGVKVVNGVDVNRLLSYVERVERLEEEKKGIQNDIKEVFQEAESARFDAKAIKELIKIRKKDAEKRAADEYILEQYKLALGL